jgi:hypothetical protein
MVGSLLLQAIPWDTRVDWLIARRSPGAAIGVGYVGGVGDGDFAAVGGGDGVVGERPVLCVGDGAGGGGFDVEVVELEVYERGVGVGADVEGALCAGGFDVPDVDVGEVGKTFVFGDGCCEGDPVGGNGLWIGAVGKFCIAVGGVPVHVHGDGSGDAG